MTPKSSGWTMKEFANRTGIPEQHVKLIIEGCYGEIKKEAIKMDRTWITIKGLGHLFLKKWALERRIRKFENYVKGAKVEGRKFNKQAAKRIEKELALLQDKFQKHKQAFAEMVEHWKENKKKREANNETTGNYTEDLGE